MENEKVLPGGRMLDEWKVMSDEEKLPALISWMKSADMNDTCVLLALAANDLLDIKYSDSVQESSVLLQFHKTNSSYYKDGDVVWKDNLYPEVISIIHKVSENHSFHSFIQNIKNNFAKKYNCLDGSSFPYISPILTLSELLLLIGTEKLRQNYRNILYRFLPSGFSWGFQKKFENWKSFALEFLNIKKGSVLELYPKIGTLPFSLDFSDTTYTVNVKTRQEHELLNIILLSDEELLSHYEKGRIRIFNENLPNSRKNERFDFVIYNCCDHIHDFLSFDNIVNSISTKGKALVVWGNGGLYLIKLSQYLHLIEAIILLERHSVILLNNNKGCTDIIKVYDRTTWPEFTADQLLKSIREQEDLYILTQEDINDMGGFFNIDAFKRKQYKIEGQTGYKLIKLGDLIECVSLKEGTSNDIKLLYHNIENYAPLSPYVRASEGKYIEEMDEVYEDFLLMKRKHILINQKLLVIYCMAKDRYRPFIFNPSDGEAGVSPYCKCFIVDEEKINIDYLVYEMNKEYFLKQLFPHDGNNINSIEAKDILSCQILVPDVESSIERQKQEIEDLRQKEIAKIAQRYGFDLGKFVQYKASDLLKGMTLRNGKYTIVKGIGHGGFGKVYEARNEETGEIVAIKEFFYHSRQVRDPETNNVRTNFADIGYVDDAKKKFRRERDKIKKCAHDNIVKVYEEFDENNTCYYVMEYIDGNTLKEYSNIEERKALAIIRQVAEALKSMHEKRFNHSDVKPQNILLDSNGVATLIDFSGAHRYGDDEEEGLSKTGNSVPMEIKTPGYTPKWAYKAKGFHAGRDIYSLGATLYYMLTGNEPATIDKQVKPAKISSKSWHAICSAMEEFPQKWLKSMDAFLALLPCDEELETCEEQKSQKPLRITPTPIKSLGEDEVFVFGSNLKGIHSGGAAKQALKLGAKWGVASGPMGKTYAIPTVEVHGLDVIERYVSQFMKYVEGNDHLTFYVTAIGCGNAGFTPEQIAPLFKDCADMSNVYLPESFWRVLMNKGLIKAEEYNAPDKKCGSQGSGKKHDEVPKKEQESKKNERGLRRFFAKTMNDILSDNSNELAE